MIKMIVMDLDGTLLRRDKTIDPRTIEALNRAKEQGVIIVIASGRDKGGIPFVIDNLELEEGNHYIAGCNGSMIYDFKNKEYTLDQVFNQEDADFVFSLAERYKCQAIAACGYLQYSYAPLKVRVMRSIMQFFRKKANDYGLKERTWGVRYIKPYDQITQDITKFVLIQTPGFFSKYRFDLERELIDYDLMSVGKMWYEIMPKGVNKGKAVRVIAQKEGIELDEILVFGDAENDLSMIETVKYGFAMGNAMDSVKEVAYGICDTHMNNGIGKTIDKFLGETI